MRHEASRLEVFEGLSHVDPTALEPGVIIADRFCVVGEVEYHTHGWVVTVSDVLRELGAGPHHRVRFHSLSGLAANQSAMVERLLTENRLPLLGVLNWLKHARGFVVLCQDAAGIEVRTRRLKRREQFLVAQALAKQHVLLSQAGVHQLCFWEDRVLLNQQNVMVTGFRHVLVGGTDIQPPAQMYGRIGEYVVRALESWSGETRDLPDLLKGVRSPLVAASKLPLSPPFVGRSAVLNRVKGAVKAARSARSQALFVDGESGMGKSRLLQEIRGVAAAEGALVVAGRYLIDAGARSGVAGALAELPRLLHGVDDRAGSEVQARVTKAAGPLAGVMRSYCRALEHLLPDIPSPPSIGLSEDFTRQSIAVSSFIAAVGCPERPLVLLLDCVGRADAASIDILRRLVDRSSHFVLVMSGGEVPAWVPSTVERVTLEPLSQAEVHTLLERSVPQIGEGTAVVADALIARGATTPSRAWNTLRSWCADGSIAYDESLESWFVESEAASVVDLTRYRLSRVNESSSWPALVLAAFALPVRAGELAATLGISEAETVSRIAPLIELGLVYQESSGRMRFAREQERQDVLVAAEAHQARRAHRRIYEHLTDSYSGDEPWRLAVHREGSEPPGAHPELAAQHIEAAQTLLQIFEVDRAAWHLDCANARGEDNATVSEGQADVALLRGDMETAEQMYCRAIEAREEPDQRLTIGLKAVRALSLRLDPQTAFSVGDFALRTCGRGSPRTAIAEVAKLVWSALCLILRIDTGPFGKPEHRDLLARIHVDLHMCQMMASPRRSLMQLLIAARYARPLRTAGGAIAKAFLGAVLQVLGLSKNARRVFEFAERDARALPLSWEKGAVLHVRSISEHYARGEYEMVQRKFSEALDIFASVGDSMLAALAYYFRALAVLNRESCERPLMWLDAAETIAKEGAIRSGYYTSITLKLNLAARKGEGTSILGAVERVSEEIGNTEMLVPEEVCARASLAEAALIVGATDQALAEVRRALALSRGPLPPPALRIFEVGARVLIESEPLESADRKRLRRCLKQMRKAAKVSEPVRVPAAFVEALLHQHSDLERCIAGLVDVVRLAVDAGDSYWAFQAHTLIARHGAKSSLRQVTHHAQAAKQLAEELGLPNPFVERTVPTDEMAIDTAAIDDGATRHACESSAELSAPALVDATAIVGDALLRLKQLCPDADVNAVAPRSQVFCDSGELKNALLLLVMAISESSTARDARVSAYIAGAGPDLRVGVTVARSDAEPHLESSACELAARRLGGRFVRMPSEFGTTFYYQLAGRAVDGEQTVESGSDHAVYVAVKHPAMRQTVIAALRRVGVVVGQGDPEEPEDAIVFVDDASAHSTSRRILVCDRRRPVTEFSGPVLPVPFEIGVLSSVLEAIGRSLSKPS